MLKLAVVGMTALFVSASAVQAQGPASSDFPTAADMKFMTDVRIEIVKSTLQLKPDQEKLWPAVEQAIRGRAETRQQRLAQLASAANDDREKNVLDLLRKRANNLNQRADGLKKLAEAWQPLYESLDNGQKTRLRFVTLFALREMRDAVASRLAEYEEDDSDAHDMPTWGMHFTSAR
jgi:hypothetical protein